MGMINGAELKDNEIGPKIVQKCFEQKVLINCTAGKRPALHSPADRQRGRG